MDSVGPGIPAAQGVELRVVGFHSTAIQPPVWDALQVLARPDEIRRQLDREDLDMEDQLVLYREGCGLVATARRVLGSVRAEVDLLMQETEALPTPGLPEVP